MTKQKLYRLVSILCIVAYIWLGLHWYNNNLVIDVCLFKKLSTMTCPACGITRAFIAMMHTNFKQALMINPLVYVLVLMLIILPIWLLIDSIKNTQSLYHFYTKLELKLKQRMVLVPLVFLILVFWAWSMGRVV